MTTPAGLGWAGLHDHLRTHDVRAAVSSLDHPPAGPSDTLVLDERDLALTADQVARVVEANAGHIPVDRFTTLPLSVLQCPSLLRRHVEHLVTSGDEWPSPDSRLELNPLLDLLVLPDETRRRSRTLRMLDHGMSLRWFSLSSMPAALGASPEDFARLECSPYGTVEVDEETGQTVFHWGERSWQLLLAQDVADLRRAIRDASAAGQLILQLFHLCLAGELSTAEELVFDHFRYFLLATNEITAQALIAAERTDLADRPNLALLIGQLLDRRGAGRRARWYFQRTADVVDPAQGGTLFNTYRLTCRRLLALVSLGDRNRTHQGLDAVREMLGSADDSGLLTLADDDPVVAQDLAAELYIPFWAAIQTDQHELAQQLGELMRDHAPPSSRTVIAEKVTAATQAHFWGAPTRPGDVAPPTHADPLLLLDSGQDGEALSLVGMLASRTSSAPTRSAMEALVLLVRVLAAPHQLRRPALEQAATRSRAFWTDDRPSSFIAAATALAHLAAGDVGAARACLGQAHPDWFTRTASALVSLCLGQASPAMAELDAARDCSSPRAQAVVEVLTLTAHVQLGHDAAATTQLISLISDTPAGLLRFALRFAPADEVDRLVELADTDATSQTLRTLRPTHAPFRRLLAVQLTRVEREVLTLLAQGLTNTEIAEHRVVSLNTVRSQIRTLLHKLTASNRAEAVARAVDLGLLSAD